MSLDELARAASSELRTAAASRDPLTLRRDLDRRLARRRRGQVGLAVAAVLALVLSAFVVGATRRHSSAPPVAPRPNPTPTVTRLPANGPIVITDGKAFFAVDPGSGRPVTTPALPRPVDGTWGMTWSADGSRLLMTSPGSTNLWDARTAALTPAAVCPTSCTFPAWSPDGRTIAVLTGQETLDVVELSSGVHRTLTTIPSGRTSPPVWSPDGRTIGYVEEARSRLVLVRATDGSPVADVPLDPHQRLFLPAWSPDGSQIALLAERGGTATTQHQLVVDLVPVRGTTYGPTRLVRTVGRCFCIGFMPGIAWSPDGEQLALVTIGTPQPGRDGLNVMRPDGTGLRFLRPGAWGQPAWQPVLH